MTLFHLPNDRFYFAGGLRPPDPPYGAPGGGPWGPRGEKKGKIEKCQIPIKKTPKKPKIKISKIVDTSGPNF